MASRRTDTKKPEPDRPQVKKTRKCLMCAVNSPPTTSVSVFVRLVKKRRSGVPAGLLHKACASGLLAKSTPYAFQENYGSGLIRYCWPVRH